MDDALEIPPYEPVPDGVVMTRAEDGFEEEARPQQAAPDPAAAAFGAAAAPVSRPAFSPVRFPTPKALLMGEYLKPEETAAAAAHIAARIPPKRHMSHRLVAVGQLPDPIPEEDDPAALFENGYLRKGGGAFLISTSGTGKSVLSMQCAFCWALGKTFFGITPVRPMKIAIIQAEDDRNELARFRNDIRRGLVRFSGFNEDDLNVALGTHDPSSARVFFYKIVAKIGEEFVNEVGALLDDRPDIDLVIINPFQSYFGADCSKNADLSTFFRVWLDREIKDPGDEGRDRAAVMFIHHTNKPPSKDDDRMGWGVDQFAAYIGAGGAEIVNWARAILSLMPTKVEGVFRLCAGKRGQLLKWIDVSSGEKTRTKIIKHCDEDIVFWLPCGPEDEARLAEADKAKRGERGAVGGNGGGGIPPVNEPKFAPILAVSAVDMFDGLSGREYRQKIMDLSKANDPKREGCSDGTAKGLLEKAVTLGWLSLATVNRCNRYKVTEAGKNELGELNF